MKNTKKSLFFSITALILCCALLAGTTMAWFTDSVSSGVNTITAGNLDIEVSYKDGDQWKPVQDAQSLFSDNLWEPGHTEFVTLKIENKGTLALKYKLLVSPVSENGGINVNGASFKLSDYLVFGTTPPSADQTDYTRETVRAAVGTTTGLNNANTLTKENKILKDGDAQYVTLAVYMPEGVGNEANYKTGTAAPTITLGIKVIATQLESENDSFGNTYDQNAVYPALVSRVDSTTSQTVTVDSNSQLVDETSFTDSNAVSNIPADTAMYSTFVDENDNIPVTANSSGTLNRVIKTTDTTADSVTYDISYNYKQGDTSTTVVKFGNVVENVIKVSKGLNVVKVTHSHNGVAKELNPATNKNAKADGTYYYDSDEGEIYVWSSEYSTFKVEYTSNFVAAVNGQGYATLEEAIEVAENGATVLLLKDAEVESEIAISKNLTLDLNGKTVTNSKSESRPLQIADCTVTVKNGSIVIPETNTSSYGLIEIKALNANVNVTLDRVTLNGNTDNGALVRIHTVNEGKVGTLNMNHVNSSTNNKAQTTTSLRGEVHLNVTGGTYVADGRVFCADSYDSRSTANFTNVTATSDLGPVIELDTVVGTFADCNFNVTNLKQPEDWYSVAIGLGYEATANIESGTYTSEKASAIEVYTTGGTFNISGGTFSGVNAIKTYNEEDSIINISGGVFTGALDIANETTNATLTGGKFSANPTDYLASGFVASVKDDGYYHVEESNYWKDHAAESYATPIDDTNKVVTIASAQELALFAKEVNNGKAYARYTVKLTNDINLAGKRWTPIFDFAGTFDGGGHTIKNLEIMRANEWHVGFFAKCKTGAKIQNIIFENANVSGLHAVAVVDGGSGGAEATFSNVTVKGDIQLKGSWYVGTIFGYGYSQIDSCHVIANEGSRLIGSGGYAGGIVGFMGEGNQKTSNCTVENLYIESCYNGIGGISGILHYGNTITDCVVKNTIVHQNETDPEEIGKAAMIAGTYLTHENSTETLTGCKFIGGRVYDDTADYTGTSWIGGPWSGEQPDVGQMIVVNNTYSPSDIT